MGWDGIDTPLLRQSVVILTENLEVAGPGYIGFLIRKEDAIYTP